MAAWVYILKCADCSYYTGCTTKLEQRIGQHNGDWDRLPVLARNRQYHPAPE